MQKKTNPINIFMSFRSSLVSSFVCNPEKIKKNVVSYLWILRPNQANIIEYKEVLVITLINNSAYQWKWKN